jgi:histidinol-phosphate aminotransferase
MKEYHPPLGSRDALRLDFNENTLACSPKVREVLAGISAGASHALSRARAGRGHRRRASRPRRRAGRAHQRRRRSHSRSLRGLSRSRRRAAAARPHLHHVRGLRLGHRRRVVAVQAADDLQFPFERLLAAITPRTKIIAIANPNSPSGSCCHARATARTCRARAARRGAGR